MLQDLEMKFIILTKCPNTSTCNYSADWFRTSLKCLCVSNITKQPDNPSQSKVSYIFF